MAPAINDVKRGTLREGATRTQSHPDRGAWVKSLRHTPLRSTRGGFRGLVPADGKAEGSGSGPQRSLVALASRHHGTLGATCAAVRQGAGASPILFVFYSANN